MSIHVKCKCGAEHEMPDDWAGKRGKCPDCGRILRVPRPRKQPDTPQPEQPDTPQPEPDEKEPQQSIVGDESQLAVKEDFVPFQMTEPEEEEFEDGLEGGKKTESSVTDVQLKDNVLSFKCSCGKLLRAPVSKAGNMAKCPGCKKPVTIPKPPKEKLAPTFDFVEDEDSGRYECPNCGAQMDKASVICIKCGTNRISGDTVETKIDDEAFTDEATGLKKALGKVSFWKRKEGEE